MKALIVDDDVVSRMALMDLLSVYGIFDMIEADDGDSAWALLQGGLVPTICFCDVKMPKMSGIDLLQRMREHPLLKDVPFVLVSSASDRETVLQAVKLGAIGYILKPLHPAEARTHLDKIFRTTIDKLAENPASTQKRLNIGPDRLSAYLGAFTDQLDNATGEIPRLFDSGKVQDARARIDTLYTGCQTLGLWHAGELLDGVRSGVLDADRVAGALAGVRDAITRQVARVRAAAAPSS